jgi:hypothetical protein
LITLIIKINLYMPTYFNGKEVKDTSIISGLSLSGKTSIKIGGRTVDITIDRPPARPVMYRFAGSSGSSGTSGYGGPQVACSFGPMTGQGEFALFGDSNLEFAPGLQLYEDEELTKVPRSIPDGYYYNFDTNQSVLLNKGLINDAFRC